MYFQSLPIDDIDVCEDEDAEKENIETNKEEIIKCINCHENSIFKHFYCKNCYEHKNNYKKIVLKSLKDKIPRYFNRIDFIKKIPYPFLTNENCNCRHPRSNRILRDRYKQKYLICHHTSFEKWMQLKEFYNKSNKLTYCPYKN